MFAPLIVAMYLLMLKHQLMSILALFLLWMSHMSIHTMDMSDLGDTLMTLGLDANKMLLKIWFCLKTILMSFEVRHS